MDSTLDGARHGLGSLSDIEVYRFLGIHALPQDKLNGLDHRFYVGVPAMAVSP